LQASASAPHGLRQPAVGFALNSSKYSLGYSQRAGRDSSSSRCQEQQQHQQQQRQARHICAVAQIDPPAARAALASTNGAAPAKSAGIAADVTALVGNTPMVSQCHLFGY